MDVRMLRTSCWSTVIHDKQASVRLREDKSVTYAPKVQLLVRIVRNILRASLVV